MKLSELTPETAVRYARVEGDDAARMEPLIEAARSYVLSYTGLTADEADELPDLTVAALVLISDMYEHRDMYAESAAANRTAETILNMYCRNLVDGA